MNNHYNFQNKKILILGLAKSGFHAAQLLHELGAKLTVNDAKDLENDPDALALEELGITVISGGHPADLLEDGFELVVKNPGIPYDNKIVREATAQGLPVIAEVEVATSVMQGHLIGITGTNGKTTTTSMVETMLGQENQKGQTYAIGNIGVPASQVALETKAADNIVMELSSFQLMGTPTIQPEIAVVTNLYSAHLDYHGSQAAYEDAKMNLIRHQTPNDIIIYNKDQSHLEELIEKNTQAQKLPFSRTEYLKEGVSIKDNSIYFKKEKVADIADIFLEGKHNIENFLAAMAVAKLKGVSNSSIRQVLRQFRGVKHRMQYVTELNDRIFYNDSKATNIEATEKAITGFDQPVILLAGGLDRGHSFDALVPALSKHVTALIAVGETADLMLTAGKKAGITTYATAKNIKEAVSQAYSWSEPGNVILLSPAAASWDQYPNFEVRGDHFITAIDQLNQLEQLEIEDKK